jgi:anhydro-N-acetylmuramic acid kinase
MSGTSLDGLDIACCRFEVKDKIWTYKILAAATVSYSATWKKRLGQAHRLSGVQLAKLDADFGTFIAQQVNHFTKAYRTGKPDLLSSHGHTVFHQPGKGFTLQIGSGAAIAALTGIPTACDFRTGDVALGGQGAPLVPVGDKLLFSGYDACLNIGGIANISFAQAKKRKAFDICPANLVLNHFAQKKKLPFDRGGKLAASGQVDWKIFDRLNALPFYAAQQSKSLGREWIEEFVLPLLEKLPVNDALATAAEHSAFQVARTLNAFKIKNVLVTGGGAYNEDLLNRVRAYATAGIIVPGDLTVQFKEALIFALLGVLRVRGEVNCLEEVTGASRDSVGGAVYF